MKMRIIVFFMLCWGLMSCLKDNGTYIYEKEPVPVLADGASEITVYCYGGDTARAVVKLEALGQDSAVTAWDYEWKLLDSVLCREKDLVMYSDDIFERINLTSFPKDKAILGVFSMRNKATGEIYQFTTSFFMRPKYWNGQWLILSENGSNSRLSYFQTKQLDDGSGYVSLKNVPVEYGSGNDLLPIIPIIRRSELHYIMCEYLCENTTTVPREAITLLQDIKDSRMDLTYIGSITSTEQFLNVLRQDARREFIGEGQSFFYYKALNIPLYDGADNINFGSDYYLPIPDSEHVVL